MKIWFTSDTHFGHPLMLRTRGFETMREHDDTLIANWNAVVAPADHVYHLGDFAWRCGVEHAEAILKKLHGRKILILGNHDPKLGAKLTGWAEPARERLVLKTDGEVLVLDHYAGRTWYGSHHGSIQLYGHSHGRLPGTRQSLDVGVDAWNLLPVDLAAIRARLAETQELSEDGPQAADPTDDDNDIGGVEP